ncbi:MAG: hypothetical protein QNJ65_09660 [Xenococcaceae cyanobacterium MO_234.B1]|nr:hypothetical protein [Xenococcaceae cyanobacterium MO_234.B1]
MRQARLNINTSFSTEKGAGIAMKYLNKEEIPLRDALGLALSCLFSPIGAAETGASQSEVEARIKISRIQFETYMNLAYSYLTTEQLDFSNSKHNSNHQELNSSAKTNGSTSKERLENLMIRVVSNSSRASDPDLENQSQNSTDSVTPSNLSEDGDYINFDEEEF